MKIMKKFNLSEFRDDTGRVHVTLRELRSLQELRDRFKTPVDIIDFKHLDLHVAYPVVQFKASVRGHTILTRTCRMVPEDFPIYGSKPPLSKTAVELLRSGKDLSSVLTRGELIALVAALQTGYPEGTNNSNPFGRYFGLDNYSWCAFLYHWCRDVAAKLSDNSSPGFIPEYSNSRQTFHRAPFSSDKAADALPGDALIWRSTRSDTAGHTGICLHNDKKRRLILYCEGNTSDKVRITARSYSRLNYGTMQFLGVCRYEATEPGKMDLFKHPGPSFDDRVTHV